MESCDYHFEAWWRCFLRRQAGIATVHDLIVSRMSWEMSMAVQKRLGALDE